MQNSIGETLLTELEQVAYELIEFLDPKKDLELINKIESRIDYWAEGNGLFFSDHPLARLRSGVSGPVSRQSLEPGSQRSYTTLKAITFGP